MARALRGRQAAPDDLPMNNAIDLFHPSNTSSAAEALASAERLRIANELHDTVMQSLASICMLADHLSRRAADSGADLRSQAEQLRDVAQTTSSELRRVMSRLRASLPAEDAAGNESRLPDTIERLAGALAPSTQVQVWRGTFPKQPPRNEEALLRICQHAVSAAASRHVDATRVWVIVEAKGRRIRLYVVDDRRNTSSTSADADAMACLRERLAMVGGTLRAGVAPRWGGGYVVASVPRCDVEWRR